jgi:hypothetical protein
MRLNTAMVASNEYLATHPRADAGTLKDLQSRAAKLRISGWTTFYLEGRTIPVWEGSRGTGRSLKARRLLRLEDRSRTNCRFQRPCP